MKRLTLLIIASLLAGCSGLNTAWVLQVQMQYLTPQDKPPVAALPEGKPL